MRNKLLNESLNIELVSYVINMKMKEQDITRVQKQHLSGTFLSAPTLQKVGISNSIE
jgi:hypothetical protein